MKKRKIATILLAACLLLGNVSVANAASIDNGNKVHFNTEDNDTDLTLLQSKIATEEVTCDFTDATNDGASAYALAPSFVASVKSQVTSSVAIFDCNNVKSVSLSSVLKCTLLPLSILAAFATETFPNSKHAANNIVAIFLFFMNNSLFYSFLIYIDSLLKRFPSLYCLFFNLKISNHIFYLKKYITILDTLPYIFSKILYF